MPKVAQIQFTDFQTSVFDALDAIGAAGMLPPDGLIIVKPNLTNADKPPVTTDVRVVRAVCQYCIKHCRAEVAIGEGCGTGITQDTFDANGYTALAKQLGISLIDFNTTDTYTSEREDALHWKQMHLPLAVKDAFIISVPVLKDHSFTGTTIAMKNMFGLAPAPHYKGGWNKSKLHSPSADISTVDICLHKKPGLCVVDAVIALAGMHLSGTPTNIGKILAGADPVAVDAIGSELMGHDPGKLEYLTLADGRIGRLDDIEIITDKKH